MFLIDKYTPTRKEDSFFHKEILDLLNTMSTDKSIPHLIFYGPEGSGKKTIIKMFLEMLYDKSVHNLNDTIYNVIGSGNKLIEVTIKQSNYHISIEPNNTNFDRYLIQDIVKEYAQRMPFNILTNKKTFKLVLINNIDNLSYYAQTSLRRTMENYSNSCRFIMWCKSLSRVIDPLKSRCKCIRIHSPTQPQLFGFIFGISCKERLHTSFTELNELVKESNNNIKTALWKLDLLKHNKIQDNKRVCIDFDTLIEMSNKSKNDSKILFILLLIYINDNETFKNLNLLKNIKNNNTFIKNYTKCKTNILKNNLTFDTTDEYENYIINSSKDYLEDNYNTIQLKFNITRNNEMFIKVNIDIASLYNIFNNKFYAKLDEYIYTMPKENIYEITINNIIKLVKQGNRDKIDSIRDMIYNIMITNIAGTQIIKDIIIKILLDDDIKLIQKYKIIDLAAMFEHNLIRGRREIIHIEALIVSIFKYLKT
jgi:DNA polymerase III delta prime subunit